MSNFNDLFNIQQRINNMCNPIVHSLNTNAFTEVAATLTEALVDINTLQVPCAMQVALMNFANSIRASINIENFNISNLSESIQDVVKSVQPDRELMNANMSLLIQNYADMVSDLNSIGYNLSELVQQACDEIDEEEFVEDDFSSNDEIAETLQEQADNPKGFQERVADWSEAKKKKYYILIGIIFFIWANCFQPYFQDTIGKPVATYVVSKVKELPKAAGKVVDELKKDFQALISEDVPYYYKVTYTDENGNVREGYVAKKNLRIIEPEESADKKAENKE